MLCVCVSVMCVHSIIHIVWGWVVIEMCLVVVVLVLCVFGRLYYSMVGVCMSHSK